MHALNTAKNDGFNTVAVFVKYEKEQKKVKAISDYFLKDYLDFGAFRNLAANI